MTILNSALVGKDPQGRYWFKSDQCLVDISEAVDFYVERIGVFTKKWRLNATFVKRAAYYREPESKRGYVPAITEVKVLGYYDRHNAASLALETLMHIKEIREINPVTGR